MHSRQWVKKLSVQQESEYLRVVIDQAETVSRRVVKFAELMQSVWVSRNDFERRMRLVSVITHARLQMLILFIASFCTFRKADRMVSQDLYRDIYRCQRTFRRFHSIQAHNEKDLGY